MLDIFLKGLWEKCMNVIGDLIINRAFSLENILLRFKAMMQILSGLGLCLKSIFACGMSVVSSN